MAVLAALFLWQIHALLDHSRWVDHTNQVIDRMSALERLLVDEETGIRGYLLTRSPEFLEPFRQAEGQRAGGFAALRRLVSDNPAQLRRLDEIRSLHDQWLAAAQTFLAPLPGDTRTRAIERGWVTKRLMDAMQT